MDLNLYLGLPLFPRRLRSAALGSGLALASPSAEDPAAMSAPPEPYSPSRSSIAVSAAPPSLAPPPFAAGDPIQEYSSRSLPLRPLAPPYVPYDPLDWVGPEDGTFISGGGSAHVRYSPAYLPLSTIPEERDDVGYAPYRPMDVGLSDFFDGEDRSSLRSNLVDPEFRLRRLIELQRRQHEGRLMHPNDDVPPDYSTVEETADSDGYVGNTRKKNAEGGGVGDDGLQEKNGEKNGSAVSFECNICLDLAQEPVVTCCGHLFCWPCLYQWLHLHCNHNECPVCKGEVVESSITPIYGRGNSETGSRESRDGDSALKIPPRPHGRRIEGWRQRLRRPISRRFSVGIANTWRHVLGEEMHIGTSRIDGDMEASLREMINSAHHRVAPRLRTRRSSRAENNPENASFGLDRNLFTNNAPHGLQNEGNTGSVVQDGINQWSRISFIGSDVTGGFASMNTNLSRIFSRSADSGSRAGASASSGNHQMSDDLSHRPPAGPGQSVEQASASSTMAVIQGDGATLDVAAEPNSVGTSRPLRRRGRSGSSLDVDGCALHPRKRRRID